MVELLWGVKYTQFLVLGQGFYGRRLRRRQRKIKLLK
jgi:hypothetical protein